MQLHHLRPFAIALLGARLLRAPVVLSLHVARTHADLHGISPAAAAGELDTRASAACVTCGVPGNRGRDDEGQTVCIPTTGMQRAPTGIDLLPLGPPRCHRATGQGASTVAGEPSAGTFSLEKWCDVAPERLLGAVVVLIVLEEDVSLLLPFALDVPAASGVAAMK